MLLITPAQAREMDTSALRMGLTSLQLMENAANGLCQAALSFPAPVCVVCGPGNNGGDGYACARLLHSAGVPVTIVAAEPPCSSDAVHNHAVCVELGIPIVEYQAEAFQDCGLIIDALLGTGFRPPLSPAVKDIIDAINASGKPVLSADIPSGMDGLTGQGECVRAHTTVTFGAIKLGLALKPELAGNIIVAGIGIPPPVESGYTLIDDVLFKEWLPRRAPDTHKGSQGHVLTIAGSIGMTGAAVFAATAAFRAGAGLVTMATSQNLYPILATAVPEGLFLFHEGEAIDFTRYNAIAVGCGLSHSPEAVEIVRMAATAPLPQVWDADALNIVADAGDIQYPERCVITPHPGEMARLCGRTVADVQADRVGTAQRYAAEKSMVTVLKGHRTVIATPGGKVYINPTGSPVMATAGMGDALAGMIVALLAQGLTPEQSAVCGVYWHGMVGQRLTEGMTVTDLIREIPVASFLPPSPTTHPCRSQ